MTEMNQLAEALIARIEQVAAVPLKYQLWDADDVAGYLKADRRQVMNRYVKSPTFPDPAVLPSEKGRGHKRWWAMEVIKWAKTL